MNLENLSPLLLEINQLHQELKQMDANWTSDDECAQAYSDPSDQYVKGEELEQKTRDFIAALVCEINEYEKSLVLKFLSSHQSSSIDSVLSSLENAISDAIELKSYPPGKDTQVYIDEIQASSELHEEEFLESICQYFNLEEKKFFLHTLEISDNKTIKPRF